jgi:hypothetical protein
LQVTGDDKVLEPYTASFAIDAIVAVYFAASRSRVPGLIVRAVHTDDTG